MNANSERTNTTFHKNSTTHKLSAKLAKTTNRCCPNKLRYTNFRTSPANFLTSPESMFLTVDRPTSLKSTKLLWITMSISVSSKNHFLPLCIKNWLSMLLDWVIKKLNSTPSTKPISCIKSTTSTGSWLSSASWLEVEPSLSTSPKTKSSPWATPSCTNS